MTFSELLDTFPATSFVVLWLVAFVSCMLFKLIERITSQSTHRVTTYYVVRCDDCNSVRKREGFYRS